MKNRNLFMAMARISLAALVVINSGIFSYSQNSRPRYSNSQPSQSSDMIPVDTVIGVRMNTYLSSKTAHVGDKFTATVTIPVYVDGKEAIPSGATIEGRVTQVTPAKRMNKSGLIAVDFDVINLPNGLSTQIVGVLTSDDPETQKQIDDENQVSGGNGKDATVFVGGSGILGAILGGVAGGGKGAAAGGAIGAGVGLATVLLSKGEEATVPTGTEFGIRLKQPLPVPTDANIYDPAQDNRNAQNNSPNANLPDSAAETRAQASQDSVRDQETVSRPGTNYPQTSEKDTSINAPSARATQPKDSYEADAPPIEENLPLTSQEMIRRAQKALNEEGYYEGAIDGVMTQRVENSLKTYQREHRLQETGILDMETARSLRIVGATKSVINNDRTTVPATSSRPNSERVSTEPASASVTVNTPTSSRPSNNRQPIETDSQSQSAPVPQRAGNSISGASKLQRQAAELLAEYQKLIGVHLTGTGIELDGKAVYTDDEISLLYAFDSFANSAQLYSRLLSSLQSQQSIRSATLAMAREARKTDRVFTTSSTRWVNVLNPKWDTIRQDILKLMYSFNIHTSELDN